MNALHFAEPQWVHGLWAVLLLLLALVWLDRRGRHALDRFVEPIMQSRLVSAPTALRRALRLALLALCMAALVVALMRPQWGVEFVSTPRVGAEIMIALDVSRSMLAEDVAPNRLERARAELRDLLPYLEGDQVGLIAFAGRASVLCPLTPDFSFLRLVLDGVHVGSVTRGGTRLEEPIRKAVAGFGAEGDLSRVIILITDGEDHDSFPLDAAKAAATRGIRILAIGFGDEAGSAIELTDPETGARTQIRDADGNPVMSRLDGKLLRELALETGGAYVPAGTGVLELESIFDEHIRPLMRGRGETRGHTVRKEGFQWAVLLALLALLGSVALEGAPRRPLALLLLALPLWLPSESRAAPGTPTATPATASAQVSGSKTPSASPETEKDLAPAAEPNASTAGAVARERTPEDPREAYNRGLESLEKNSFDDAAQLFEAARSHAHDDGEVRFRATYDLGWLEARRADARMKEAPEQALTSLERAAGWFREAIALRSGNPEARRNLEIVLQRSLLLADSLSDHSKQKIGARLDGLIERQRTLTSRITSLVVQIERSTNPHAADAMRPAFSGAAVEQRKLLAEASTLAQDAGRERDALEAKDPKELEPKQRMRAVALGALLEHLHDARERLGQARSQLRRRQATRAFRRAATGLGALKRARDQLRDPVSVLTDLIGDTQQLVGKTNALADTRSGSGVALAPGKPSANEAVTVPSWLSTSYLAESQERLGQRTGELDQRLAEGVAPPSANASDDEAAKKRAEAMKRVAEAEAHVGRAREHFEEANRRIESEELAAAAEAQTRGLVELADGRELFLDLKGLIELAYTDEERIARLIHPEDSQTSAKIAEYGEALSRLQERNFDRVARMPAMLEAREREFETQAAHSGAQSQQPQTDEETGADLERARQQMERARGVLALTESSMKAAVEHLSRLDSQPAELGEARRSVASAHQGLEDLRRLFFSLIEHLRDAARRQVELGDRTQEAATLAESEPGKWASALAPLADRQSKLAGFTEALAQALHEQALAPPPSPADPDEATGEAARREANENLTRASEAVLAASEAMEKASDQIETKAGGQMETKAGGQMETKTSGEKSAASPELTSIREQQKTAVDKLGEALALLQPESQKKKKQKQPQKNQQEQQAQQQKRKEQQAKEQGADGPKQRDRAAPRDPSQILQAVRDREAARHKRGQARGQSRYEPVDKDW